MDTNGHEFIIRQDEQDYHGFSMNILGNKSLSFPRRRESILLIASFILCVPFLSGCIIPWPHTKDICPAIYGTVIAQETETPVENALIEVEYEDGKQRKTRSNEYGYFHVPPRTRFYWGVLFCVALNHSLPLDGCQPRIYASVEITAHGYDAKTVSAGGFGGINGESDCPEIFLSKSSPP